MQSESVGLLPIFSMNPRLNPVRLVASQLSSWNPCAWQCGVCWGWWVRPVLLLGLLLGKSLPRRWLPRLSFCIPSLSTVSQHPVCNEDTGPGKQCVDLVFQWYSKGQDTSIWNPSVRCLLHIVPKPNSNLGSGYITLTMLWILWKHVYVYTLPYSLRAQLQPSHIFSSPAQQRKSSQESNSCKSTCYTETYVFWSSYQL